MGFEDPIGVDQDSRTKVELAAGGLVWRGLGRKKRLAVVHRPKHGDWTLPKGRLRAGESLRKAAQREVREETGCDVEVQGLAGVTVHHGKGLPKIVFYWHMQADGPDDQKEVNLRSAETVGDGEEVEVDKIEWLTAPEAAVRLSHREERQVMRNLLAEPFPNELAWWRRLLWPGNIRLERLRREVSILEKQLPRRSLLVMNDTERARWFEELEQLTGAARRAADDRRTEDGWAFLQAARQIEVLLYSPDEVESEGRVLLEEAKHKLTGWRREGVEKLLSDGCYDAGMVMRAMIVRDANFANVYYRIDLERRQLLLLLSTAGIALLGLVDLLTNIGIPFWWAPSLSLGDAAGEVFDGALVLGILLAGTLGASLSAVLGIGRSSSTKIPDKLNDETVTLGRVGIGAAAALVVSLFLITGIGGIEVETIGGVIFLSIVAGASERFLKRALAAGD